jgi:hypothetical protein
LLVTTTSGRVWGASGDWAKELAEAACRQIAASVKGVRDEKRSMDRVAGVSEQAALEMQKRFKRAAETTDWKSAIVSAEWLGAQNPHAGIGVNHGPSRKEI